MAGVGSGEPGLQLVHERSAVTVDAASGLARIRIRDNGPGIAADELARREARANEVLTKAKGG